jgi:hypothetical protein
MKCVPTAMGRLCFGRNAKPSLRPVFPSLCDKSERRDNGIVNGATFGDHGNSVAKLDEASRSCFLIIVNGDAAAPERMAMRIHERHSAPLAKRAQQPVTLNARAEKNGGVNRPTSYS